ncbi:MFS transporter [Streptomyces misionensis]|uniref:MFS transporter n=1 Tax=Streptomyces misionensis TaxID=67331 RepID=A0A5C6K0A5_9ACTN|nr:MFS transporter [Streptomyces misionensis]TWV53743.1 MFS transporter [Streptomyces misionensis]
MSGSGAAVRAEDVLPLRRNRDFLLLWSGAAVSFLGSRVNALSYPLLVLWHTDSPLAMSTVSIAALLPQLLVQLPAGALVDRWDRRRVMVLCEAGRFLALGSVAVVLVAGGFSLAHLVLVACTESTLAVFYRLAERGAVRNVVHPAQLRTALSRNEARGRAAGLFGQPGGVLLQALARWAPFAFTALGYLASLIALLLIRKDFQERRTPARPDLRHEVAHGLGWLLAQRFLRAALGYLSVGNLLLQVVPLALVVLIKDDGHDKALLAVVVGLGGLGGVLGALSGGWWERRFRLRTVFVGGLTTWAVLVLAMARTHAPVALGALFAGTGFVGSVFNVVGAVHQVRITPDALQGRVVGTVYLLGSGANVLGPLLGGLTLQAWGGTPTLVVIGGLLAVLAVAAALSRALHHDDDPVPGTPRSRE